MADAAARREARRRRILENSENRLQRITGSKSFVREDEPNNSYALPSSQRIDSATELLPKRNACPNPTQPKTTDLFDHIYSEDQDVLIQSLSYDLHTRNVAREGSSSVNGASELQNRFLKNQRIFPDERQNSSVTNRAMNESEKEVNLHDMTGKIVVPAESSLLYNVLASKWTLVLLAALVNVVYILQLQHFCGKTILAPFFTFMLPRLYLDKLESRGGNMLSTTLNLCNMKPELVRNLSFVLRISKKITEEFSIYIFSFVILYNAAYSYHDNTDITTSAIDCANNEL